MKRNLFRKISAPILAAWLFTSIVLLNGTMTAAQRRYHRRVISMRSITTLQTMRPAQRVDAFSTFGPFGRPYHPFWDPYGRYDRYTFYRHSFDRKKHTEANPIR